MADFNFTPAKSNIAAQPGMSLGEMMNMATQAQALQQAQERVIDGLITEQQPQHLPTKVTNGATADL